MGYIDSNLMNGEEIIYKANIHWVIFIPSALIFLVAIFLYISDFTDSDVLASIAILISLYSLLKAFITKITTELAITSKRIVVKVGLIRRNTIELNHNKVESFNIDQTVLGRIFFFGTLIVNGTGGGKTAIPSIDNPLEFRKNAMELIDGN